MNHNNGNWKVKYKELMVEFDKLRQAYELESGQVWFGEYGHPTGDMGESSEITLRIYSGGINIVNEDE